MKTITLKPTKEALSVSLYLDEDEPELPAQQVTINHHSPHNQGHPRNVQVSNEFIFVKRYGSPTVAMHLDDFIALCALAEPRTSWPPHFVGNEIKQGNPVVIESKFDGKNPELPSDAHREISYQWQSGDDHGVKWQNIDDGEIYSGTKTNKLSIANNPGDRAKMLRCLATNAAGTRASKPVTSAPYQEPPNLETKVLNKPPLKPTPTANAEPIPK